MPRLDIILLPLLGGYLFLITFNLTKFYHLQIERQRLLYNSLGVAVILAFLVFTIDFLFFKNCKEILSSNDLNICLSFIRTEASLIFDHFFNNYKIPGLKHCLCILFISWPIAKFLNLFFSPKYAYNYTINKWGTQFDRLIWKTIMEKKLEDKLLMITMKNFKVYIGHVNYRRKPIGETDIRILPMCSGYRDKDTHRITIGTIYTDIIADYSETNRSKEIDEKLGIIIPVCEITSLTRFDNEIFGRLNSQHKPPKNHNQKSIDLAFLNRIKQSLVDFLNLK